MPFKTPPPDSKAARKRRNTSVSKPAGDRSGGEKQTSDLGKDRLKPLQFMPGVGPKLGELLATRMGIQRLEDLWFHLPLRYQDRSTCYRIASAPVGYECLVRGEIEHAEITFRGRRALTAVLFDGSARLRMRFFHFRQAQLEQMQQRPEVRAFGELRANSYGLEMVHPELTFVTSGVLAVKPEESGESGEKQNAPESELQKLKRLKAEAENQNTETVLVPQSSSAASNIDQVVALTPVYPKTEGLSDDRIRKLVQKALASLPSDSDLELLPAPVRKRLRWHDLGRALRWVHQPPLGIAPEVLASGLHPMQRRLAGEELLSHQLSMRILRQRSQNQRAPILQPRGTMKALLLERLGFQLTGAQIRVSQEISAELMRSKPMLRLVQGDVGSGKTVVAALAAIQAIESGMQVALVAPTELLAEQHFRTFSTWLGALGIELVWLAGKVKGKARSEALAKIAAGAAMVIGTHALMTEQVHFQQLGLCIIDEQHRFGVRQRLELRNKGVRASETPADSTSATSLLVPHQLVMTATPIPRTLAMVSYADLDVSVIDELPPGRTPIKTVVLSNDRREELIARIRAACQSGRQAYWVCTLIEESELLEAKAAEQSWQELQLALPELAIGLVHGRLKAAEKDAVMQRFAHGELQVLVATTVIEVGVDVPNASLMLIDNAERLGLSQLHQLRGRVGRGAIASSCVLMYQAPLSLNAKSRLHILRESTDGFVIAERDLELRGPGEFLGTKQTGKALFRIADLQRDGDLLEPLREVADQLLEDRSVEGKKRVQALIHRWIGDGQRFGNA